MKNNQFAFIPTEHNQIINELIDTRFLTPKTKKVTDPVMLWRQFLVKFFIEHQGLSTRIHKLENLMATKNKNANDYTLHNKLVSKTAFYNVGLQLLGYQVDLDFELDHPIKFMHDQHLMVANMDEKLTCDNLIDAWYVLLNSRTKQGPLLIDYLASQGYYAQYFSDAILKKPLIFNGKTQAVFDTSKLIYDVVYVETDLDNDQDGKRDLVKVEVIRPKETEDGLKVPTLYTASPYNQGTNDEAGEKMMHNVNRPISVKPATDNLEFTQESLPKSPEPRAINGSTSVAEASFSQPQSYSLNDYFLARGFAVVYCAGIGTKSSGGFRTTGSQAETRSTTAVIEWLNGKRTAFTNHTDNIEIKAFWSNHHVGMTGKSYLGTLATAAATTGVDGLKACIVEAGISNWYNYYRENGLVVAPGGFQGEDADVLAEETFSRQLNAGDYLPLKDKWIQQLKRITAGQDRESGNYNSFWQNRNYLPDVKNIQADMLIVHGLNDTNVKPIHANQLWNALKSTTTTQKMILHQGQHIYINNLLSLDFNDIANVWLTNKLLDIENHANDVLPDVLVQDNTQEATWNIYNDWDNFQDKKVINLNDPKFNNHNDLEEFSDQLDDENFKIYTNSYEQWHHDLVNNNSPLDNHVIRLMTQPISQERLIDGTIQLNLSAKVNSDHGLISVAIVDYGIKKALETTPSILDPKGLPLGFRWKNDDLKEFKFQKHPVDYKIITNGHINLQNLKNSYEVNSVTKDQFMQVNLAMQPTFYRLLSGHQLGIIIYATDFEYTLRGNEALTYTINMSNSQITLPIHKNDKN